MSKVFRLIGVVCIATVIAQGAGAYGADPVDDVTKQQKATDTRIADACAPRLSPRMAAAFGLPVLTAQTRGCSQG